MINKITKWFEKRHKEKMKRMDKAHLSLSKFVLEMDEIERKREKNLDRIEKIINITKKEVVENGTTKYNTRA